MLLSTKGKAWEIQKPIVGKVTRDHLSIEENCFLICEDIIPNSTNKRFIGYLTNLERHTDTFDKPLVSNIPSFSHLADGDIVVAYNDGNISTLYRKNSFHNTLLATERCNSNCIMCSQPPKDRDDILSLFSVHKDLIPLIPKDCLELGISGGEPTLMGEYFFELLELIQDKLPETEIHVLTNGRSFAWPGLVERLAKNDNRRLMLGIPLYSDYYQIHDYIVQAKNAFNQTVIGLHKLARYNQRIEIRVVLHKQTIPRLKNLAKFIFRNLPFAEHITFMGLEYIGYTPHNINQLWIDPYDYQNELSEAVEYLSGQGMNVSIYNSQLCLLPEHLWKYCRKSISDWKNSYLSECTICSKVDECGGLFTWNLKKHSQYIKPFPFRELHS